MDVVRLAFRHAVRGRWPVLLAAGAFALGLALTAACGDDDGAPEATPTAAVSDAGGSDVDDEEGPSTLVVLLDEWSVTGEGGLRAPRVRTGEIIFDVRNDGETPHELAVLHTGFSAGELPVENGVVNEESAGTLVDRTSAISPGESEFLTVELVPGAYALICNIPAHYEQGMYAQLIVVD